MITLTECAETCDAEGSLRLEGWGLDYAGRVEICHNHEWGTICVNGKDLAWKEKNAQVVCRALGFSGALNSILQRTYVNYIFSIEHTVF